MRSKSCLLLPCSPDHPTINSSSEVSLRLRSFVPSDAEFVLNCAPNSKPVHIVARGQFPGSVPAMHCITWQLLKFVSTCQSNCWDDFFFFHSMSIMLAARAAREWEREYIVLEWLVRFYQFATFATSIFVWTKVWKEAESFGWLRTSLWATVNQSKVTTRANWVLRYRRFRFQIDVSFINVNEGFPSFSQKLSAELWELECWMKLHPTVSGSHSSLALQELCLLMWKNAKRNKTKLSVQW